MRLCLALALIFLAAPITAEPLLVETARLTLRGKAPYFGGFSGIDLNSSGEAGWIIMDRGRMMAVTLHRNAKGHLLGATIAGSQRMPRPKHDVATWRLKDTEGLALLPDGTMVISMEVPARLWSLSPDGSTAKLHLPPADLEVQLRGAGLEALAVDPLGRLVTLPESHSDWYAIELPVIRISGDTWRVVSKLTKDGPFLPVGADFGPDGMMYLLERAVSLLGFRSRIRRFDPDDPQPETLFESRVGQYDNLEGLAISETPEGALRITTVSDNNFLRIQRSELVEFVLQE